MTKRPIIDAVGSYLPPTVETTRELERRLPGDVEPGWIEAITGVRQRHISDDADDGSDLALLAVQDLLTRASVAPAEIDCLIYGAAFSDVIEPATAHILQAKLGWDCVPCFDAGNACNGVFDGVRIAEAFIRSGMYRTVLVASGEVLSHGIPWPLIADGADPMKHIASFTIGDAGGAILVRDHRAGDDPDRGIYASHTVARSDLWPHCLAKGRGSLDLSDKGRDYLICDMKPMAAAVHELAPGVVQATLEAAGWSADDVEVLVPHQVSPRLTAFAAGLFGRAPEEAISTLVECGNCASANLPLALEKARKEGVLEVGKKVFLGAGSAGLSLGGAAVVW